MNSRRLQRLMTLFKGQERFRNEPGKDEKLYDKVVNTYHFVDSFPDKYTHFS